MELVHADKRARTLLYRKQRVGRMYVKYKLSKIIMVHSHVSHPR